jgi:hypothetical protein
MLLASTAAALLPRRASAAPARSRSAPSKLLYINLSGGVDELHSMNPKVRSEVKPKIGPVFTPEELTTHNNIRLAPAWAPLADHAKRMQVLAGVQCHTVAHETGVRQILQMRTSIVDAHEPTVMELIGEPLAAGTPGQLASVNLGMFNSVPTRGRGFYDEAAATLTQLHRIANDPALYDVGRHALADVAGGFGPTDRETLRSLDRLLEKMRGTELPKAPTARIAPTDWPEFDRDRFQTDRFSGIEFSWAHYILANDLAPVVGFVPFGIWDTHTNNDAMQLPLNRQLALWMKELLDKLAATPRPGGRTLLDETGIILLSELGRFPYANSYGGKDHFPQIAITMFGPGLANDRFGETDSEQMGTELSLRTGKPGRDARLITLDDVGRTLLEWYGHRDAEQLGYDGSVLEFCFA